MSESTKELEHQVNELLIANGWDYEDRKRVTFMLRNHKRTNDRNKNALMESIARMRAIPAEWKHLADPIGELQRIRDDPDYNPWENPQYREPFVKCCEACDCDAPNRMEQKS